MSAPPPLAATPSNTARPADKGANAGRPDAALVRRAIDGIAAVTGCRRREARERIHAWVSGGISADDLEAWLRQNFRVDPTGVIAVRNVMKGQR